MWVIPFDCSGGFNGSANSFIFLLSPFCSAPNVRSKGKKPCHGERSPCQHPATLMLNQNKTKQNKTLTLAILAAICTRIRLLLLFYGHTYRANSSNLNKTGQCLETGLVALHTWEDIVFGVVWFGLMVVVGKREGQRESKEEARYIYCPGPNMYKQD